MKRILLMVVLALFSLGTGLNAVGPSSGTRVRTTTGTGAQINKSVLKKGNQSLRGIEEGCFGKAVSNPAPDAGGHAQSFFSTAFKTGRRDEVLAGATAGIWVPPAQYNESEVRSIRMNELRGDVSRHVGVNFTGFQSPGGCPDLHVRQRAFYGSVTYGNLEAIAPARYSDKTGTTVSASPDCLYHFMLDLDDVPSDTDGLPSIAVELCSEGTYIMAVDPTDNKVVKAKFIVRFGGDAGDYPFFSFGEVAPSSWSAMIAELF